MITNESIQALADVWYKKLDVHAPMVEVLPMLADKELEMVFPEATIYGWAGFEGWFQRVIRIFFDEIHTLKEVTPTIDEHGKATVTVIVKWEASVWNAPEATSKRITADAYQTWEMAEIDGKTVITKYVVDDLKYYEGSATL